MDIAGLRQARAQAYDKLSALQAAADKDNRALTAEEQTQFDAAAAEVEAFDKRIKAAERLSALKASTAIPAPAHQPRAAEPDEDEEVENPEPEAGRGRAEPRAIVRAEPGINFARAVRAIVVGKGDLEASRTFATETWGERHPVSAALQANDGSAGGFLIPENMSMELVALLRPKTVIRRNSRVVPLVGGNDSMPTVESGSAAYYIGEGADIQGTEPSFGNLKFTEREIAALVPISNKLLRNASQNVDVMVRDDMSLAFAQAEDMAFLRSQGLGAAPKGIRYLIPAGNVFNSAGATVANIDADARKLINALILKDITMANARWVMNGADFGFLQDLRDGNGNPVYPGLNLPVPMWKGYPVEVTNNQPINLGGGANQSEISLVDFSESVVADSFQIRIDASETASYKVGGTLVSAYSRNQTVIRAVAAHDYGLRRVNAAAVLAQVTWGR